MGDTEEPLKPIKPKGKVYVGGEDVYVGTESVTTAPTPKPVPTSDDTLKRLKELSTSQPFSTPEQEGKSGSGE